MRKINLKTIHPMIRTFYLVLSLVILSVSSVEAQRKKKNKVEESSPVISFDSKYYNSLKWRNIGPFRGGRSNAASGVIGDPLTYYFGSVGGGVWKTTDAGTSWSNITDGFLKTGTVGAIEVAASDQNVIYVGMGEHAVRGVMTSSGDGIYRSTDAGRTWTHKGLDDTKHISGIAIHPDNPDWLYVAAQGAFWNDSDSRGIYMSKDGGDSWEKMHEVNASTGAADIVMDENNPRILYAAYWDHRRLPWQVRSGGPGSGIYKSVDGGQNWKKIVKGLPEVMGKVSVTVSPANSDRLYANIEAEGEQGGVYRSDNGGASWRQVNKDRVTVARAWYYIEIFADPQDAETVYVLNAPMLKSIDGGKTFTPIPNPHTDQHDLWINPDQPANMILANDGGACITFNGGKTWSSQNNQPTAQFYRVITDNQFPYRVYAGQQDNSTVSIASKTMGGGISRQDWYPVAGGESAFIAFDDADNPRVTYGTSIQGFIDAYDVVNQTSKDIMAHPSINLGTQPKDQPYRWNWNNPIINGYKAKNVLYHGAQLVLESTDGGYNWKEISPDLTRNDPSKHDSMGVPFTNEAAGGEVYNTISYLANSMHEPELLYAGSDDGLVHIRKDEGSEWVNISPLVEGESLVNAIEVSPHDPAKVYVVITRYKFGDHRPFIFRSTDYGQTWENVGANLKDSDFVRVVREDPNLEGLLYAGTERGLFVSFDDGQSWSAFQSNLPVCPITDLIIKDNDLVAATSGRGFWILDDLGGLQQGKGQLDSAQMALIEPKPTHKFVLGGGGGPNNGKNPLVGVTIDYYLPHDVKATDTLELSILNESGDVIRSYTSIKDESFQSWPGGPAPKQVLPLGKGMNRFNWDLRREEIPAIKGVFVFGSPVGAMVGPGTYKAQLNYKGQVQEQMIEVLADPRIDATEADYSYQQELLDQLDSAVRDIHGSIIKVQAARGQLEALAEHIPADEQYAALTDQAKALAKSLREWEAELIQPKQKTFQDVINFENQLSSELLNLMGKVDAPDPHQPTALVNNIEMRIGEWKYLESNLDQLIDVQLVEFNNAYTESGLPIVIYSKE